MGFTEKQRRQFETLYNTLVEADGKAQMKILQMTDTMIELMVNAEEAEVKHIRIKNVIPHAANRGGAKMEIRKIYLKGSKIVAVGFSLARCGPERAVCFSRQQGSDEDIKAFIDFANASEHLPTYDGNKIEATSVGCGHLNVFLACIRDETEVPPDFHGNKDLFGQAGGTKLDRQQLCKADAKDLDGTLDRGLLWTCIPWTLQKKYPKLPHIIQKALNVEHHIGEGETWDEQLLSISRSIAEHFRSNSQKTNKAKVDYHKIARATMSSKPPREDDVPSHLEFCKKWGGGESQQFIKDICDYIKSEPTSNIVNGCTFDALAKLQIPGDSMCPRFIAAIVKCAATRGKSREGVSIHLSEGDIRSVLRCLGAVKEAETLLEKAATIDANMGGRFAKVRGAIECDIVEFILRKMPNDERDKTSLQEIANKFLSQISGIARNEPSTASAGSSEAKGVFDAGIFDATGNVAQQTLANHGWKVGGIIAPKAVGENKTSKADRQLEIAYVNDDGTVGLSHIDADGHTTPDKVVMTSQTDLQKNYKHVDANMRLAKAVPLQEVPLQDDVYMYVAGLGVAAAYSQKHKCPSDAIYFQEKPSFKVIVASPSAFVFVAYSNSLKAWKESESDKNHIAAIVKGSDGKALAKYTIERPGAKKYGDLEFWKVRKTSVLEQCNMELRTVEVRVDLPKLLKKMPAQALVEVTVAVPRKEIAKDDELVLFVPSAEKKPVKHKMLPVLSDAKKARTQ